LNKSCGGERQHLTGNSFNPFKPECQKNKSIVGAGLGTQLGELTITEQQNPPFI